jgi:hypothetical protein
LFFIEKYLRLCVPRETIMRREKEEKKILKTYLYLL